MQVFVLCVLMLLWNQQITYGQDCCYGLFRAALQEYRFVEHYAGAGELTKAAWERFGRSVKMDKDYHRAMDILTPAGFASFG